jgi:predicted DNA-binding helix-hairpin-helix protein
MECMLETVSLVRRQGFRGYVHTKILPGASRDQVRRAAEVSTRLSVNAEAPAGRLTELSSTKDYRVDLLRRMRWIREEVSLGRVPAGQTTQFIVGAAGESDAEIVEAVEGLYGEVALARCYFSAFTPVDDTPLGGKEGVLAVREHRLYQVDFLLRQYGFKFKDVVFDGGGFLPHGVDPKLAFAREHPELYPVDLNGADYATLLRVPGIGPKTARKIISQREFRKIHDAKELGSMGVQRKALSYLEVGGLRQRRLADYFPQST